MNARKRVRIGFPERDSALTELGRHFVDGRVSVSEYSERCDAISAAITQGDLDAVFLDLDRCGDPDQLRISSNDRQTAMNLLSQQFVEGRLTVDEFSERSACVAGALTVVDLRPLFSDLPVALPPLE
jgi:hypothetical protein